MKEVDIRILPFIFRLTHQSFQNCQDKILLQLNSKDSHTNDGEI